MGLAPWGGAALFRLDLPGKVEASLYFNAKPNELPPPGRWIMITTIDELGSGDNAVKGLGQARLSMYLFDRDQGSLLWHDQATKEHVWGGLLGNLVQKGEVKQGACRDLVYSM